MRPLFGLTGWWRQWRQRRQSHKAVAARLEPRFETALAANREAAASMTAAAGERKEVSAEMRMMLKETAERIGERTLKHARTR